MRAEWVSARVFARLFALVSLLAASPAHAQEALERQGEGYPTEPPPEPSRPGSAAEQAAPRYSADPCDDVPQCRLDRFRRRTAARRRAQYLQYLDQAGREMDDRVRSRIPYRTRFPFGIDLLIVTNVALPGVAVSYAPTWWFKPELWFGRTSLSKYTTDELTLSRVYNAIEGTTGGLQMRFLPVKFAVSPYLAFGWGAYRGSARTSSDFVGEVQGTGTSHFFTFGLGIELTVPYFHLAAGYQYISPFYGQGFVEDMKDEGLKKAVDSVMDNSGHGAAIEVGCAF